MRDHIRSCWCGKYCWLRWNSIIFLRGASETDGFLGGKGQQSTFFAHFLALPTCRFWVQSSWYPLSRFALCTTVHAVVCPWCECRLWHTLMAYTRTFTEVEKPQTDDSVLWFPPMTRELEMSAPHSQLWCWFTGKEDRSQPSAQVFLQSITLPSGSPHICKAGDFT